MAGPPWIIDPDAWDRVRSMADSFSDVQALFEYAEQRHEEAAEKLDKFPFSSGSDSETAKDMLDNLNAATRRETEGWARRKSAAQAMIGLAFEHGWDWPVPTYAELPDDETIRHLPTRIARHIVEVLEAGGSHPESPSELLKAVDHRRGRSERSTYRYLHDHLEQKPSDVEGWEEWARAQLNGTM